MMKNERMNETKIYKKKRHTPCSLRNKRTTEHWMKKKYHKIKINMTVVDCTYYPYQVITSISFLFFQFFFDVMYSIDFRFFCWDHFFVMAAETNKIAGIDNELYVNWENIKQKQLRPNCKIAFLPIAPTDYWRACARARAHSILFQIAPQLLRVNNLIQ